LILFAYSRWFWLSLLLLLPAGFSMMLQMSSSNTLIQAMVPDRLRGRVMAAYVMMFMGMAPMVALFAGIVAERLGAPLTVAIGGAVCLIGSGVFAKHLPALRWEARQLIVASGMAGGEPPGQIAAG
jgi:MFS family permease